MKLTIDTIHPEYFSKNGSLTFSYYPKQSLTVYITYQPDPLTKDEEKLSFTVAINKENFFAILKSFSQNVPPPTH